MLLTLLFSLIIAKNIAHADAISCSAMEIYDVGMAMCMPLPMANMPMAMAMFHGNAFITGITETGARGKTALAAPNMFMFDIGKSIGSRQYFNLDYMGTVERWTYPDSGYPELLQIGEENSQGVPYIDAQHPHSSPVMGLTLSDTITFGEDHDYLKIFTAPRGEATDGPVAFMHRPTGMVNPDAPLGHHIGQDVGHIVSTLLGASLNFQGITWEFSTFHGAEPSPQSVDLPLGTLDSYSLRVINHFSDRIYWMVSYAYVSSPEPNDPDVGFEKRYSASLYLNPKISEVWDFKNTLIWGTVFNYDHASSLTSFLDEFLLDNKSQKIWGRIEVLQRTPNELQVVTSGDENTGLWESAYTLGFTQRIMKWDSGEVGLGGSITNDILSPDFQAAYNGNPWTGKIFLNFNGDKMWEL